MRRGAVGLSVGRAGGAGVDLLGEAQRAHALVQMDGRGGEVAEHEGLAVAAEGGAEEARQGRLAEGHVALAAVEGTDDVAQHGQALVDRLAGRGRRGRGGQQSGDVGGRAGV